MTMALILAVPRRLVEGAVDADRRQANGRGWSPTWMLGHRIWGKRLGIIGMGRIGQAVARRARPSACRSTITTAAASPAQIEEELEATYWESLDQMLARMDIISVNCPHTPATYHLLSARRLKLMRPRGLCRQHRARRGDRRERARPACSRRARSPAPASTCSSTSRPSTRSCVKLAARRQGRAAAAYGLGHDRRPHRHGREGHHQHQDLHRRPQAAGPRAAVDAVRRIVFHELPVSVPVRCRGRSSRLVGRRSLARSRRLDPVTAPRMARP